MISSAKTIRETRKQFRLVFSNIKWEDARGRRFKQEFWQPLDEILTAALSALEQMEKELAEIKQRTP